MRTREELAWAAGVFDGEGYIGSKERRTPGNRRNPYIHMVVGQYHREEVVYRFHDAIGWLGKVRLRARGDSVEYTWAAQSFEHVQATVAMLWPFLSAPKREQAIQALASYHGLREVLGVRAWRRAQ